MIHRVLLFVTIAGLASPAWAQDPPQQDPPPPGPVSRPTRALFGGGPAGGGSGHSLMANLSAGGGYNHILFPKNLPSQGFGSVSGSLDYSFTKDRLSASASLDSSAHFLPNNSIALSGYSTGASLGLNLTKSTALSVSQTFSMSPYSVMQFFQQDTVEGALWTDPVSNSLIDPTFATGLNDYYSFGSSVSLSQQFSKRGSINAAYSISQTTNRQQTNALPAYQTATFGMGYMIAKGLTARIGYTMGIRERVDDQRGGSLTAGVDFGHALSLSRRATVSFDTGIDSIHDGALEQYRFNGSGTFSYQLGRSWTASAGVNRNAEFIDTIALPLLQDRAYGSVSGLLARRLQMNASIGVAFGQAGLGTEAPSYNTSYASLGLQTAITRNLAIGTYYTFSRYQFDSESVLPEGATPRRDRQSIRVSLNTWLPLLQRSRRSNDSR